MNSHELQQLVIRHAATLEKGGVQELKSIVEELKALGITKGMHLGRGEDMEGSSEQARILFFEWLLGQLIEISDTDAFHCVNSWINYSWQFRKLRLLRREGA